MRPFLLPNRILVSLLLVASLSCKRESDPDPVVCRLVGMTDQNVDPSGNLTNVLERGFTYNGQALAALFERSARQEASFQTVYENNRLVRATNNQATITFDFAGANAPATRATYASGGRTQTVFTIEYTTAGRLSKIVEARQVLPTGSLINERTFTFTYDANGNLINERSRFGYVDGTAVVQETDYTFDANASPYTYMPEPGLMTLMALIQNNEGLPGRFWHQKAPSGFRTYAINANGTRGSLRESTTISLLYDADNKLTAQEQNSQTYTLSVPTPISRKSRQAFTYQCQ
ncbi:hypothetical protein BN8_00241 [Fibrisoma limi BUZ 3]|uniref:DUF4595 domain-containing protein n=1 Tax=Fibrisoma limi BUZ 3 TaxID=1185876 RepID=I2GBP9_9BACT|nr:hypothetical protein [Fibrisoma limi]CCH51323.1 hypothetical protein BN8_00241 [Fibrisoma limi BUZ 3]